MRAFVVPSLFLNESVEAWKMGPFHGLLIWRCIPFSIMWSIWKRRKDQTIRGKDQTIRGSISSTDTHEDGDPNPEEWTM